MVKRIMMLVLLTLYLYHLNFGIFLNDFFRIPTPLLFGIPLIIFFREHGTKFVYMRQLAWFVVASFLFNYVGNDNSKEFFVDSIIITICALFFSFFIGRNRNRLSTSIIIFYALLFISTCVMFLNHIYRGPVDILRSQLIGSEIGQSPTGITNVIFSFGYQLATLDTLLYIYVFARNKSLFWKGAVLAFCLAAIYFGLQRSVLAAFLFASFIFFVAYYKAKSLPIMFFIGIIGIGFSSYFVQETGNYDNIFAKNERKGEENRSNLAVENLKIYTDYPFGLIFYGKNWSDVSRDNAVFRGGLTSHNAYLMFLTYLGPFIGVFLLLMIYYKHISIFKETLFKIRDPDQVLMVCLCFSFLAVSLNSLFHNAWLVGANSQAVFLYFAILSLNSINREADLERAEENAEIVYDQPSIKI